MINFIIWLVLGGVIGWVASIVMRTDAQQGILLNIIVGIVGAMLGGMLLSPIFGVDAMSRGNFSLPALGIAFLGAVVLLAIVNLFRKGSIR